MGSQEELINIVVQWFSSLGNKGSVEILPPETFRAYFEMLGYDFSSLTEEDLRALSRYTVNDKGPAITKIMGVERKNAFIVWVKAWAEENTTLGLIKPTEAGEAKPRLNVDGPKALLYDLLAYTAGAYDLGTFLVITTARMYNGRLGLHGIKSRKENRLHIYFEGYEAVTIEGKDHVLPFAPASFPPSYPMDLYRAIIGDFQPPAE